MDANHPAVIVSKKKFPSKRLSDQKNPGWVFYYSGGTWAWNIGSGSRRLTYERDNGKRMPLNDGKWHQLTMTYNAKLSEVRLYYDGINKAIYHISDEKGFDFTNKESLTIGSNHTSPNSSKPIAPEIKQGEKKLQALVNSFNQVCLKLDLPNVKDDQLEDLVVDPHELFDHKVEDKLKSLHGTTRTTFSNSVKSIDFDAVTAWEDSLMENPYTVHQVRDFMEVAPLLKIYSLKDGKIMIRHRGGIVFTKKTKFYPADFDIDNLTVWDRTLSSDEIIDSYTKYFKAVAPDRKQNITSLTIADWNIHHGGKHFTVEKDGWDSRKRVAEMLQKEHADIILMQETYSSGDFIAAELGYYFATTVDWDYLNQGSNISILSRYPIKDVYVPEGSSFMDVGAKIAISKTQDIYVMSNWYGMTHFPEVFRFHRMRFQQSDTIPVIFAGDFNSVPDADGSSKNLVSRMLLKAGFTDAFRSIHPDVKKYPGYTHNSKRRIDQLYYKGKDLDNISTEIISTWSGGFPSDHYLAVSKFGLKK